MDFYGPFQSQILLITVDSYSKWLEMVPVALTTMQAVNRSIHRIFATHGLPNTVMTNNGTAFTSGEFQTFLQQNLIWYLRSAPFQPP